MSEKQPIDIHAPGIDTEAVVREIREAVAKKAESGVYNDARIARAERTNLVNLKNDREFLTFYLNALRDAAFIDINDYAIYERRPVIGRVVVKIKTVIWKLLKFYTFRMWSQQNTVNGLFVTGLESMHEQHVKKIEALEARIAELEKKLGER